MATSTDAVFAATTAWGLALLACAATPSARPHMRAASAVVAVMAGLVLGWSVFLSYGMVVMGALALADLILARTWRPLPWALAAAVTVALAFLLAGFNWWEGSTALTARYWEGIAHHRPGAYWTWANLAVLCVSAGPGVAAGLAVALGRWPGLLGPAAPGADGGPPALAPRRAERTVVVLATVALGIVLFVTASQFTRAETERIWLPFFPWLLTSTGLLGPRWARAALVLHALTALAVQHALNTYW